MGKGGGEYEQAEVKLYIPVKAESALRSSDTLPSEGLNWPEYGQLLLNAVNFRPLFAYCCEKKKIRLSRYTRMVVQNSNIGHLHNIFRYKTLILLRSYSTSKRQEKG